MQGGDARPGAPACAIYARFSSEMQSPRSTDDQKRECAAFAQGNGWDVVRVEEDRAVRSGATAGRTGYRRLLDAAKRQEFSILLVEELSRFSRDFLSGITELASLKALGVHIADTKMGLIDLDTLDGQLRVAFGFATGQHEVKGLGERSKRGLKGKVLDRKSAGGQAPYGYQRVPEFSATLLDVDGRPRRLGVRFDLAPVEAAVVRRIFELYAGGHSKHGIARHLNGDGIPTRRAGGFRAGKRNSGTWGAAGIKGMLENRMYRGERVWNKTSRTGPKLPNTGKKAQLANDPSEWIRVADYVPAIIDAELWERVQLRLAADARQYTKTRNAKNTVQYPLSGLLRCASCGASFVIGAHQGRPRVPHYRCSFRSARGSVVCLNRVTVPQPAIEKRVRHLLDVVAKDPEQLKQLVAQHNKSISSANEGQLASVRALEARRREAENEQERLVAAVALGTGAAEILVREVERRASEIAELDKKIEEAEALVQPLLLPHPAAVRDYVTGSASLFHGDVSEDQEFLRGIIEGIYIYTDGAIVVRFKEASLFEPVKECRINENARDRLLDIEQNRVLHDSLRRGALKRLQQLEPDAEGLEVGEYQGFPMYRPIRRNDSLNRVGVPSGI
jgi:site-specific DNA recombinase